MLSRSFRGWRTDSKYTHLLDMSWRIWPAILIVDVLILVMRRAKLFRQSVPVWNKKQTVFISADWRASSTTWALISAKILTWTWVSFWRHRPIFQDRTMREGHEVDTNQPTTHLFGKSSNLTEKRMQKANKHICWNSNTIIPGPKKRLTSKYYFTVPWNVCFLSLRL